MAEYRGVYIKGIEMPTSCEACPCKTSDAFGGLGCQATGYIPLRKANQDRPEWCPLFPAADVVSRGAYDQTDWERCVALTQLKEIGKSFGERMDDVRPVVLCRDCKCYRQSSFVDKHMECARRGFPVHPVDFCSFAEKREES